jgi:CBS domain-containing protein
MSLAAILRDKGSHVVSVPPDMPIRQVAAILNERRIGAVLVCDDATRLLGIVSERDIVRSLALRGAETLSLPASELMTRTLRTIGRAATIAEAMAVMTQGRCRHLPVLEDGSLVGLVSIGDVVKARLEEQGQEVDSLKAYVSGALA